VAGLQSDKTSLQANGSDFKNQLDDLTAQKNGLQFQVDDVLAQSNNAASLFWLKTATAAVFAFTTAFLSIRGRTRKPQ